MSLVPRCTICDSALDPYGRDGTTCRDGCNLNGETTMDIESKRFQVRSMRFGGIEIMRKSDRYCVVKEPHELPSANAMAMMKERDFDRAMEKLICR
jgi:hypothetical protein